MDAAPNASVPTEVQGAAERLRVRARKLDDDLAWILSDARGRRFLGNLIFDGELCHTMQRSILPDASETLTAVREGERNIGSKLLVWIEALSFDAKLVMERERHAEAVTEATLAEVGRKAADGRREAGPVHPYDGPVA